MFFARSSATIMLLSRFSRLVLPSPVKCSSAAMCVQPRALARKAIQYMVLYCLTPPLFDRYSWLNLCPPYPAGDGVKRNARFAEGKGIRLVNRSRRSTRETGRGSVAWSHERSPRGRRYPSRAKAHVFMGWRAARLKPCHTRSELRDNSSHWPMATAFTRSSRCLN